MSHTPVPWKVAGASWTTIVQEGSGARIAKMEDGWPDADKRANAAIIVRAVNSYDDLLAACEAANMVMLQLSQGDGFTRPDAATLQQVLETAIAKAKGKGEV